MTLKAWIRVFRITTFSARIAQEDPGGSGEAPRNATFQARVKDNLLWLVFDVVRSVRILTPADVNELDSEGESCPPYSRLMAGSR